MVDWKIRAIALALTVTLLGLSVAADDDDDDRSPGTNQGGYYFPPGGQQYYPQPPRRSPFIYPPYRPTYRPTPAPRRSSFDMSQFVIIYILLQTLTKTTTTAAATTTTMPSTTAPHSTVCIGSYSDWSVCSATCSGTQTRKHSCTGVVQTRQCNLPGFVGGWYRAANCYEYIVRADKVNHDTASTNCEGLGAKIIHVGLRNATITADLMDKLKIFSAPAEPFHIGLAYDTTANAWIWEDKDPTAAIIWAGPVPAGGAGKCAYMTLGNAVSGAEGPCTGLGSDRIYICERKVT